ncbi:MAG TPA: pectate lyase, partial [Pirellulales bacterium]
AYLNAYLATDDKFFLDAATETALALVNGQLKSGGWSQTIHFGPAERLGDYRTRQGGKWNRSSLDDGQTQSALRFLLEMDYELSFKHAQIHDAARYGLDSLIAAQFANGAFPQVFAGPATPQPIAKAKYPNYDWKTEGRLKNYWDYYTLNDGLAGTVSDLLIDASKLAENQAQADKAEAALRKLGDFLILAQMPDPQPGWCQQYNYAMEPIWARKFEPPAITGSESQDVMRTLIKIATFTGDAKYLEPIPRAADYFEKHLLSDGQVARYYELQTSKPLYMDKEYKLTYDDSNVPEHYGWKKSAKFDEIAKQSKALTMRLGLGGLDIPRQWPAEFTPERYRHRSEFQNPFQTFSGIDAGDRQGRVAKAGEAAKKVLAELDAQGRWVSTYAGESLTGQPKFAKGFKYISSEVFAKNLAVLGEYLWALEE